MELVDYYRRRAPEYESIYFRPDAGRLEEQEELARAIRSAMLGRDILEVAAGTGYWTVHAASVARSVVAVDAAPEPLEIARAKPLPAVDFHEMDAFALDSLGRRFTGGLACFWLSHVPKARLLTFLTGFHARLLPGATVILADNLFVPGFAGELELERDTGDTYTMRTLSSGESTRVLKNYFDRDELQALLGPSAKSLDVHFGRHFWRATYQPTEDI